MKTAVVKSAVVAVALAGVVALAGCSTSDKFVRYVENTNSKPSNCALDVYSENLELNRKTKVIAEMSVTDTAFSVNCSASTVVQKIKEKACSEGADAIHLYDVVHPNWRGSTCFQAKARFLIYAD